VKKILMLLFGLIIGNLAYPFIRSLFYKNTPPDIQKWGYLGAFWLNLFLSALQIIVLILIIISLQKLFKFQLIRSNINYLIIGIFFVLLYRLYDAAVLPLETLLSKNKIFDTLIRESSLFGFALFFLNIILEPLIVLIGIILTYNYFSNLFNRWK